MAENEPVVTPPAGDPPPPAATPPVTPPAAVSPPAATPPAVTPPAAVTTPPAPTPPPPPAATPPRTVAEATPPENEPKAPTPATWPDDWRQKLAGDDKRLLARLERMSAPTDILNAWRSLEQRLSSGEFKRALPHNPTEDEVKAYRESNGIPEKPEDYDLNIGNGFVWGELDKPFLEGFTKHAHEANIPGDVVKSVLGWVAKTQQAEMDQLATADENYRVTGDSALRALWGNSFNQNINANRNLFEGHSIDSVDGKEKFSAFDVVMGARAPDGRKLGSIPGVLQMFAGISRELNPVATLVPDGPGGSPLKTAEARLSELNNMMADKRSAYWRGPQADTLQAEWRDLYSAIQKQKERAA